MKKGVPVSPDEIGAIRHAVIPERVFDMFNELINRNWDGRKSIVYKRIIMEKILEGTTLSREKVYSNGWLEIDDLYREKGWIVIYNKPSYNEFYEPYWTFSK